MTRLLLKAHVKGYFRNGKWIPSYETKAPSAKPDAPAKPDKPAAKLPLPPLPGNTGYGGGPGFFSGWKSKPAPKPQGYHPQLDDSGDDVPIYRLSKPTPLEAFADPEAIATVLPGGPTPTVLNGVPLAEWEDAPRSLEQWQNVEGQADILEPELKVAPGQKVGAGVIVQEPDGRVWVVHPTNGFGGYKGTFPKGTVEDGLSLQASAIKEAFEESGLKVEIIAHLMDVKRTTSTARYYLAKRVGGSPAECGWESQSVSLVPPDKLYSVLNLWTDHGLAEKLGAGPPPKAPPSPKWPDKPSGGSSGPSSGGSQGSLF